MIDLLSYVVSPDDVVVLVGILVALFIAVMIWWDYYARPCRNSLRNIERALLAAPWMQPQVQQRLKRSA